MKKASIIILLIFFIALANYGSGKQGEPEIMLSKTTFFPGETLQAEIYGIFIDGLDKSNVALYRERQIPVIYDLGKVGKKYLLYMVLPEKPGNYSIRITGVKYETASGVSDEPLSVNFSIVESNLSTFSVRPGFVITSGTFTIFVKSLKESISVDIKMNETEQKIELLPREEKKVVLSVPLNYSTTFLVLSSGEVSYSVPVFVYGKLHVNETREETPRIMFIPSAVNATILKGEEWSYQVYLWNYGNETVSNITVITDSDVDVFPTSISLDAGEKKIITIKLKAEKDLIFNITASVPRFENFSAKLYVRINVTKNDSAVVLPEPIIPPLTCSEKNGTICSTDEICQGEEIATIDGNCCLGKCVKQREDKKKRLIGIFLLVLLLVIVAVVGKLSKKKPQTGLKQKLTER